MTNSSIMRPLNVKLIKRMYQDHDYTVEEIADRLRYPIDHVTKAVNHMRLSTDIDQRPK
jgi:hypothetical protein